MSSIRGSTPTRFHYTYHTYEEWGRGYIGVRSCNCLPEDDVAYLGSFTDKDFNPTQKDILRSDYKTREEANKDEMALQDFYDVVKNPYFANRAKHTSTGFCTEGTTFGEETRQKMSESHLGLFAGENNPNFGKSPSEETREKIRLGNKGKHVSVETRQKQSDALRGENNPMFGKTGEKSPSFGKECSEETRNKLSVALSGDGNPSSGTSWWVNANGETIRKTDSPGSEWQKGRKWRTE